MSSVSVWRIAVDAPLYAADDLSGEGARLTGGRWNSKGTPVVYAAQNIALACLETFVHLNAGGLPLNRYLVEIVIPQEVWQRRQIAASAIGWDAIPIGNVSLAIGSRWTRAANSALLCVPSVIIPEERNVLINPAHPDAQRIQASKLRKWLYDPRLTS